MKKTPLRRRTALKAKTGLKQGASQLKRTALRRKSLSEQSQRKQDDRAWFEASKGIIRKRSGGRCEFIHFVEVDPGLPHGLGVRALGRCGSPASDAHHINRQSQGHDHSPDNLMDLCRVHHSWIHDNVAEARALGYLSPAKRGDL
ncbi:hypothetical protein GTQ99_00585 [Kineococcus sp. T13]|uniref:HNH endonuclease signature motif containing protein n=1 Tax=Kineococcus vitellinus TaxID=2696565 RepID=UPI0014135C9C|nr:HNH endonuclease [Kineococcus vitellinus]NAZ73928.1 hypothetical protein [Kineococcus vitellinus]